MHKPQWMKTRESANKTDYIFYPIEFISNAIANVISLNYVPNENIAIWVVPVDKQKFINGFGQRISASYPSKIEFDVISVGF